jgi:hypothetical protein
VYTNELSQAPSSAWIAGLNAAATAAHPPFPGALVLRKEGGPASEALSWSVTGASYDHEHHEFVTVVARWESDGNVHEVSGLPPGDYTVGLEDRRSGHLFRKLIQVDVGRTVLPIQVGEEMTVTGVVAAAPSSPPPKAYFVYGTMGSGIDANGSFTCHGHVQDGDRPWVLMQIDNPFPTDYGQRLFNWLVLPRSPPIPGQTYRIALPSIGSARSLVGQVVFSAELRAHGFSAFHVVNLDATASDGSLIAALRPDDLGRFVFSGLPRGVYRLAMSRERNPIPLTCRPLDVEVGDQLAPSCTIEVSPLPPGSWSGH